MKLEKTELMNFSNKRAVQCIVGGFYNITLGGQYYTECNLEDITYIESTGVTLLSFHGFDHGKAVAIYTSAKRGELVEADITQFNKTKDLKLVTGGSVLMEETALYNLAVIKGAGDSKLPNGLKLYKHFTLERIVLAEDHVEIEDILKYYGSPKSSIESGDIGEPRCDVYLFSGESDGEYLTLPLSSDGLVKSRIYIERVKG